MERLLIYGASESGQKICREYGTLPNSQNFTVLAFVDGNPALHGDQVEGLTVISPDDILKYDFDTIIIAALQAEKEIFSMLVEKYGIPKEKISNQDILYFFKTRELFCQYNAQLMNQRGLQGSVAEVGVWKGGFAKYINGYFSDRKLYLFDTFAGLDEQDIQEEKNRQIPSTFYIKNPQVYADTSVEMVRKVLPYPHQAIFMPGYFPESARNVQDEFVFVSLDLGLYKPTLAGLEFFYPRMVSGGIILCHDYYSWQVEPGAHLAIDEFCSRHKLYPIAIGDRMSVAIIRA